MRLADWARCRSAPHNLAISRSKPSASLCRTRRDCRSLITPRCQRRGQARLPALPWPAEAPADASATPPVAYFLPFRKPVRSRPPAGAPLRAAGPGASTWEAATLRSGLGCFGFFCSRFDRLCPFAMVGSVAVEASEPRTHRRTPNRPGPPLPASSWGFSPSRSRYGETQICSSDKWAGSSALQRALTTAIRNETIREWPLAGPVMPKLPQALDHGGSRRHISGAVFVHLG
jgi:hypothetical protein